MQHLQLVQALTDPEAEVTAWKMLARVCSEEGKYGECLEHLEQARKISDKHKFVNDLRRIHCLIGVARGMADFSQYTEKLLDYVVAVSEP